MSSKLNAQELVRELRASGVSAREIADELQRDPRMVSKILRGEARGDAYVRTLQELVDTGHATTVPPRRRTKAGKIVPVRAPKGGPTKSVVPEDTGGRYVSQPKRGRFTSTSYLTEGGRLHDITLPKTKNAKGRAKAGEEILSKVRAAARDQRWSNKQVKFKLTYANGRTMEVGAKGGYDVSRLLSKLRGEDDQHPEFTNDPIAWLVNASKDRYTNLDVDSTPITGVTMTVFSPVRPKTMI